MREVVRSRDGEKGECDYEDYPDCVYACTGAACEHWRPVVELTLAERNQRDIQSISDRLRETQNELERMIVNHEAVPHSEDDLDEALGQLIAAAMVYVLQRGIIELTREGSHGSTLAKAAQTYYDECFRLTEEEPNRPPEYAEALVEAALEWEQQDVSQLCERCDYMRFYPLRKAVAAYRIACRGDNA